MGERHRDRWWNWLRDTPRERERETDRDRDFDSQNDLCRVLFISFFCITLPDTFWENDRKNRAKGKGNPIDDFFCWWLSMSRSIDWSFLMHSDHCFVQNWFAVQSRFFLFVFAKPEECCRNYIINDHLSCLFYWTSIVQKWVFFVTETKF